MPLPDELRDELSEALIASDKPRNLRRINESLWHLTLVFLGEIDPNNIKHIVRVCNYFKRGFGTFTFDRLESFPALDANPKMLVANGVLQPIEQWRRTIKKMRNELTDYAQNMQRRKWDAHVTLARVSSKTESLPKWQKSIEPWTWTPGGFQLVHSTLTEHGPIYKTIHEFPFSN
jgi:2'-5' RNA ligase